MQTKIATAVAHPNIAFIKYWGNTDNELRIPTNGSLSMNLSGLETRTTIEFNAAFSQDELILNGAQITDGGLDRVSRFLDQVRQMADVTEFAAVKSKNNFPTGSGIASSASAYAALALASSAALQLSLEEKELSKLARTGSGSACRSIPEGFVEWQAGSAHEDSYAYSIAPKNHWDLIDHVAVISQEHKPTGSTGGHALAPTSPLQISRVSDADRRLEICRAAMLEKDFDAFADIVELDSNIMHAVMMTSKPNLFYWEPTTIEIMKSVQQWRAEGLQVCYTIDAGPNVHVITTQTDSQEVKKRLEQIETIQKILSAKPGGAAYQP